MGPGPVDRVFGKFEDGHVVGIGPVLVDYSLALARTAAGLGQRGEQEQASLRGLQIDPVEARHLGRLVTAGTTASVNRREVTGQGLVCGQIVGCLRRPLVDEVVVVGSVGVDPHGQPQPFVRAERHFLVSRLGQGREQLASVRSVGQRGSDAGVLGTGRRTGHQSAGDDRLKSSIVTVAGHLGIVRRQPAVEIQPSRRFEAAVTADTMTIEHGLNVAQEAHRLLAPGRRQQPWRRTSWSAGVNTRQTRRSAATGREDGSRRPGFVTTHAAADFPRLKADKGAHAS